MSKTKKTIISILVVLLVGLGLYSAFRISFYGALTCVDEGYFCNHGSTGSYSKYLDDECCEGLEVISIGMEYRPDLEIADENGCVRSAGSGAICWANCGNGVCEDLESFCNCPEDCQASKEEKITNDSDDFEEDGKSCDEDKNCLLTSTNLGCADCDYADSSWQCLSQEKRLEIRQKRQEYMSNNEDLSCVKCMPSDSPLMFRCVCESGECMKTASCDSDDDCNHFPGWSNDYKCIDNQCRYVEK